MDSAAGNGLSQQGIRIVVGTAKTATKNVNAALRLVSIPRLNFRISSSGLRLNTSPFQRRKPGCAARPDVKTDQSFHPRFCSADWLDRRARPCKILKVDNAKLSETGGGAEKRLVKAQQQFAALTDSTSHEFTSSANRLVTTQPCDGRVRTHKTFPPGLFATNICA